MIRGTCYRAHGNPRNLRFCDLAWGLGATPSRFPSLSPTPGRCLRSRLESRQDSHDTAVCLSPPPFVATTGHSSTRLPFSNISDWASPAVARLNAAVPSVRSGTDAVGRCPLALPPTACRGSTASLLLPVVRCTHGCCHVRCLACEQTLTTAYACVHDARRLLVLLATFARLPAALRGGSEDAKSKVDVCRSFVIAVQTLRTKW